MIVIYGPNPDDPTFYDKISDLIDEFENISCILCGDFNLVLNPDIDYFNYSAVNNEKAREKLLEIIDIRGLVDPFRELYPEKKDILGGKNPL